MLLIRLKVLLIIRINVELLCVSNSILSFSYQNSGFMPHNKNLLILIAVPVRFYVACTKSLSHTHTCTNTNRTVCVEKKRCLWFSQTIQTKSQQFLWNWTRDREKERDENEHREIRKWKQWKECLRGWKRDGQSIKTDSYAYTEKPTNINKLMKNTEEDKHE